MVGGKAVEALGQLFRYQLLSDQPVGGGGCGLVWSAQDNLFGQRVAIKTINELLMTEGDAPRRTFVKEAMAGARLGQLSRHIVKVFDVGVVQDLPYLVMEWITPGADGRIDVSGLMGRVSLARAKVLVFQICDALRVAHEAGIVHSDIAPWNIVFDSAPRLYKLGDFGLLKIVEERLLTKGSGTLLKGGRAAFQPPEVRDDISRVGYGSDVYGLAMTLRVLIEGDLSLHRPLGEAARIPPVVRIAHEQRDAPPQLRSLLARFIGDHSEDDRIGDFVNTLQRVPN